VTTVLILLVVLLVAAYALLRNWSRSERARVGLDAGAIQATDDSAEPAPTLRSPRYGLVGRPDQLVRVGNALIPVEQKPRARRLYSSHTVQVAAQCLLVQEVYGIRPPYGIVVLAGGVRHQVDFSAALEQRLLEAMNQMRAMLASTASPEPHWVDVKCHACGFRQTCWGDGAN
jgi:CRISPR-associated exonuclease Cas4